MLKDLQKSNGEPGATSESDKHLGLRFHVSERRACRVLGQHRSTQRYQSVPVDYEQGLVKILKAWPASRMISTPWNQPRERIWSSQRSD